MFIIKELVSWLLILIIIISNTFFNNNNINHIMFTLVYVISYILCTTNFLSLLGIMFIGLIFDSINNINIGISSVILLIMCITTYSFKSKIETHYFIKYYLLGAFNFILLISYIKVMKIFFHIHFVNLIAFYIISILILFILLPIITIINKILNNVK